MQSLVSDFVIADINKSSSPVLFFAAVYPGLCRFKVTTFINVQKTFNHAAAFFLGKSTKGYTRH